ncbi:hypothetical protein GW796_00090 [archaeon]|nr:hypothetical protein [archaeon]
MLNPRIKTKEINLCPMCGSRAEVFATGAAECYGYAWQSYGVECKDEFHKHCDMNLSISADFFNLDVHNDTLIDMWNSIKTRK